MNSILYNLLVLRLLYFKRYDLLMLILFPLMFGFPVFIIGFGDAIVLFLVIIFLRPIIYAPEITTNEVNLYTVTMFSKGSMVTIDRIILFLLFNIPYIFNKATLLLIHKTAFSINIQKQIPAIVKSFQRPTWIEWLTLNATLILLFALLDLIKNREQIIEADFVMKVIVVLSSNIIYVFLLSLGYVLI